MSVQVKFGEVVRRQIVIQVSRWGRDEQNNIGVVKREEHLVQLEVDFGVLAADLGEAAVHNKGHRATLGSGAIVCTLLSPLPGKELPDEHA